MKRLTSALILLFFIVTSCVVGLQTLAQSGSQAPQPPTQTVDRTRLEIVEDLSESLANDLLELPWPLVIATRG